MIDLIYKQKIVGALAFSVFAWLRQALVEFAARGQPRVARHLAAR